MRSSAPRDFAERIRCDQGSSRVRVDIAQEFGKPLGADVVTRQCARLDIHRERGWSVESLGSERKGHLRRFPCLQ